MSDTTRNGPGDDVLAGGFDQTNGVVGGLDGDSDGTAGEEDGVDERRRTVLGEDDNGVAVIDPDE